jgi:hypothetical protein
VLFQDTRKLSSNPNGVHLRRPVLFFERNTQEEQGGAAQRKPEGRRRRTSLHTMLNPKSVLTSIAGSRILSNASDVYPSVRKPRVIDWTPENISTDDRSHLRIPPASNIHIRISGTFIAFNKS